MDTKEKMLAEARKLLAKHKMTPATASKLRRLGAELCGCTLCYWAITPCLTNDEWQVRVFTTEENNASGDWGPPHKDWAQLLTPFHPQEVAKPEPAKVIQFAPKAIPEAPADVQEVEEPTAQPDISIAF